MLVLVYKLFLSFIIYIYFLFLDADRQHSSVIEMQNQLSQQKAESALLRSRENIVCTFS